MILAPAKLNLCLYVGPTRDDGLHELASLFCPLELADRLDVRDGQRDRVICAGVEGPNLVATALDALRARGWRRPAMEIEIQKRIPVAAGLGGGSADAAALLRLAGDQVPGLEDLAVRLGSDVPSQLRPGFALVEGAGERIGRLPDPPSFGLVLIPSEEGLRAGEVYAEADRIGRLRDAGELASLRDQLRKAAATGASPLDYVDLLGNDLQRAVLSLRPEVAEALDALDETGAARALVTGSGPTAFGLYPSEEEAELAAAELSPRFAGAIVTGPRRML